MAATSGTMVFTGASGKTYIEDIYFDDTAGNVLRWDEGAGAGAATATFKTFPENVFLTDFSVVTGAGITRLRLVANGRPTSHLLRLAVHLTTLNERPKLAIGFKGGTRISGVQVT